MAAMEYSMIPESVPISYISDYICQESSSRIIVTVNLSSLQNIAELLGEGQSAENISNGNGVTIHFYDAGVTLYSLVDGKSIATLKCNLYPNLRFAFGFANNTSNQIFHINIIDISTGEALQTQVLGMINKVNNYMDIYNINSKTKVFAGGTSGPSDLTFTSVIFTENGIICLPNVSGVNNCNYYRIILPNGQYADSYLQDTALGSITSFERVFYQNDPSIAFPGVYVETRGLDLVAKTLTFNTITYKIFGNNGTEWTAIKRPKFVISSEIIGK